MDQKPKHVPTDEIKSTSNDVQASTLVFISAHAISSLGFAVSLLAIWFGWLLPAALTASAPPSDAFEIKKQRHHKRSPSRTNPPSKPDPVRRASAPVVFTPAPILVPHPEETTHDSSKRVYFADSPSSLPVTRRNTMPTPQKQNNLLAASIPAISRNSSPSRPETPPNGHLDDLNAQDADSSSTKHSCLHKFKFGFNLKSHHPPVDKQSDRDSITSIESTPEKATEKRTNGGFVAAWSNSRLREAGNDIEPGCPSPSRLSFVRLLSPSTPTTTSSSPGPADILSPTSKADRRSSTPIPRTYPYGAPYFASPPVLLDKNTSYPTYLKTLPQFEDEIQFSSARADERGREPAPRKAPLGHRCRTVCKRRSASEDWTVRPSTAS